MVVCKIKQQAALLASDFIFETTQLYRLISWADLEKVSLRLNTLVLRLECVFSFRLCPL